MIKPQLRELQFDIQVFDRPVRNENTLVNAIAGAHRQTLWTRKIEAIMSPFGTDHPSLFSVSPVAKDFDHEVPNFLNNR